jgi:hypothetical protein
VPTITVPTVSGGSGSTSSGSGGIAAAAKGAASASSGSAFMSSITNGYDVTPRSGAFNPVGINLTVNGALDSEGTARTIVNMLNDSFYRGTGGANALQGYAL